MCPPTVPAPPCICAPICSAADAVIGVHPSAEYQFRIFCTPVGPYFKGGAKPITIRVSDYDRAAPHGTGNIKAGLNYAMSLYPIMEAHRQGFDENMYLDPATRTKVEETGGANFLFVTKDGKVVTPKSDSILPSITRRSLVYVAREYLGLEVEEREVYFDEVKDFAECGLCGTAAVISPVGKIVDHGKEICIPSGMEKMGEITQKLYDTLTGIQMGRIKARRDGLKCGVINRITPRYKKLPDTRCSPCPPDSCPAQVGIIRPVRNICLGHVYTWVYRKLSFIFRVNCFMTPPCCASAKLPAMPKPSDYGSGFTAGWLRRCRRWPGWLPRNPGPARR